MKETTKTISMAMSMRLASEVFAWLKEKEITTLDSIQHDILASRYHKVFFDPNEKMNQDEKCEFFGVLIDAAEDFLDEMGITTEDIPNDEREDESSMAATMMIWQTDFQKYCVYPEARYGMYSKKWQMRRSHMYRKKDILYRKKIGKNSFISYLQQS